MLGWEEGARIGLQLGLAMGCRDGRRKGCWEGLANGKYVACEVDFLLGLRVG